MTKRNNKGFSLIDVIIAVAVLTLLVSPILYQVVQTLKTSRESKQTQYVLDNAQYVVGYFQNTPLDELAYYGDDNQTVNVLPDTINTSDSKVDIQSYTSGKVKCELYCAVTEYEKYANGQYKYKNGQKIVKSQTIERIKTVGATPEDAYAEYNASVYKLSNSEIGYKGKTYSREVLINDLSNSIMEMKNLGDEYTIAYNIDPAFVTDGSGWELQSDGSCVKYGSCQSTYSYERLKADGTGTETVTDNRNIDNVIVAIVCEKKSDYVDSSNNPLDIDYINPNTADIGFIQDLDASKVALIQGNAAGFDKQAEQDFFTERMNQLKNVDKQKYLQVLTSMTVQTGFNREVDISKITKIDIHKGMSGSKVYYQVDCNVYYYDAFNVYDYFNINIAAVDRMDFKPISLNYSVYSQKFYSDRSPDIYLVYEPFVTNSSDNTVEFAYAKKDYIIVSNDNDCKDSKLYLIKPNWDQLSVKYDTNLKYPNGYPDNYSLNLADNETVADTYTNKYPVEDVNKFYTKDSRGTLTPVEIKFIWLSDSVTTNRPLKVYTNITTEDPANATLPSNRRYSRKGNFKNYDTNDSVIDSMYAINHEIKMLPNNTVGTLKDYYGDPTNDEFITQKSASHPETDIDYILPVSRDSQDTRRLYNVIVSFTELENGVKTNKVTRYSGGKENN